MNEGDLPRVAARMNALVAGAGAAFMGRWRWLVKDNPWQAGAAFGEVLVDERGTILGHGVEIAQPCWAGDDRCVAWLHMGVWIDPSQRGGMSGFQVYKRFHSRHRGELCATTSANAASAAVWERLGARPQPATDTTLLAVLRPVTVAAVAAYVRVRGARRLPSRWAMTSIGPYERGDWVTIEVAPDQAEPLASYWQSQRERYSIATDRDACWLRWRYGSAVAPARLVGLMHRGRSAGFYAYRIGDRGGAVNMRVMTVLDWVVDPTDKPALAAALADVRWRAAHEGASLIEVKGCAQAARAAFIGDGYRARPSGTHGYWVKPPRNRPDLLERQASWHLTPGDGDVGFG